MPSKYKRPPFQKQTPLHPLQKMFVDAATGKANRSKRQKISVANMKFIRKENGK